MCVVIDDIDAALKRMSPLGRDVVGPAALTVRSELLAFAQRRGWCVVSYDEYARWGRGLVADSGIEWLVLDPLLPLDFPRLHPLRVTRRANGISIDAGTLPGVVTRGTTVGLLDDASSSGTTIYTVSTMVEKAGARVSRVAVCASSSLGRGRVMRSYRNVVWSDLVRGDWPTLHLRDGCPYLPFSGRRSPEMSSISSPSAIELRTPATMLPGSVWHSLTVVRAVCDTMRGARHDILMSLETRLGRQPIIDDLTLLGSEVPAVIERSIPIHPSTELRDLLLDN